MAQATPVPLQAYKTTVNGQTIYSINSSYNTPYGYTPVTDLSEVQSAIDQYSKNTDDWSQQYSQTLKQGLSQIQSGQPSGYAVDPNTGALTTQSVLDQNSKDQAALAAGTEKNIGTAAAPLYIPTGSPAASTSVPAPAGTTPVAPQAAPAPGQPVQQPAATQTTQPGLSPALQAVYQKRPDLQNLYNPDGSAKNPNDPAVAGIPTLQDWSQKYGVNEEPTLQGAPAGSQTAETGTGTTGSATSTPDQGQAANDQVSAILAKYGINLNPSTADLTTQVMSIYNQVYGNLGVASVKSQLDDYNSQLLTLKNKVSDETVDINNDPWIDEGTRAKQVQVLQQKYEGQENNLIASINLTQSLYESGVQQAQTVSGQVTNILQSNQAFSETLAENDIQAAQANAQKQADARSTLANGQPFFKYEGSDQVFSTATGQPLSYEQYIADGGAGTPGAAFGDVYEIPSANTAAAKTQVLSLMQTYPDAGILPTDDLNTATNKFKTQSAIYREQVRPPASANTGTGSDISELTPYLAQASDGSYYVDLSSVTGKTKNDLAQLAGANGIHVITNTNSAADLTNIQNAYANLDTMSETFSTLTSPSAASRALSGIAGGKISTLLETNAQKTAASSLNDASLDLLKAISGIQGFRGNQSALDQIKAGLPTIYDTQAVATQKLANVRQLIANREQALLGTTGGVGPTESSSSDGSNSGTTSTGLNYTVTP